MASRQFGSGIGAALALIFGAALPGISQASLLQARTGIVSGPSARADPEVLRFLPAKSRTRAAGSTAPRLTSEHTVVSKPRTVMRADNPVMAANTAAAGQAGYVHYFLLRLPDDTLEIQVGIETPDQRIAWSFPDLGVVISPFIESGIVAAGGKDYEVWHLYGIRPFPDDAAMDLLGRELTNRIQPWIRTATSYCENDGPRSGCMSCLGFVLRMLFPGKSGDYPDLPRDFWRAGMPSKYTTTDLLLYLTGMLELHTREARLRRAAQIRLPQNLREDVEELVYSMGAAEAAGATGSTAPKNSSLKRPEVPAAKFGVRPALRRKL